MQIPYIDYLHFQADCGIPMNIDRATISYDKYENQGTPDERGRTLEQDGIEYICGVNTEYEGSMSKSVCQVDGKWSKVDMYCRRK